LSSTTLIFTQHTLSLSLSLEPAINKYLNGVTRNHQRRVNSVRNVAAKVRERISALQESGLK